MTHSKHGKPAIRKLLDTLRSGKWVQHSSHLGLPRSTARCCLGVLQEIAPDTYPRNPLTHTMPSTHIAEWAGLDEKHLCALADTNDRGYALGERNYESPIRYLEALLDAD